MPHLSYPIPTPSSFQFSFSLQHLNRSPLELLHHVEEEGLYKSIPFPGRKLPFHITASGSGSLEARLLEGSALSEAEQHFLQAYLSAWFDLDRDLHPFYQLAADDPLLGQFFSRLKGLRLVGVHELFEALAWAIMGQQINLAFAYKMKARLVEQFGESYTAAGRSWYHFPTPAVIANIDPDQLKPLQFSRQKATYLKLTAQEMVSGRLSLAELQAQGDLKAKSAYLTQFKGIGPWTAHYALMRCLREADAYPIADAGLHQAVRRWAKLDRKPTYPELESLAEGWKGWRGYATFYLWRSLRLE
ncbi:MAG: DNA-3-methyladenine glycosylase 2 [Bacteroidota bacterium]